MIGIIVAVNGDWVMGKDGGIPWRYPGDLRRFAYVTADSTVVMGRKTWESIPERFRPLKGRRNVVVSRTLTFVHDDVIIVRSVADALSFAMAKTWFIGGREIYEAAMPFVDVIDVTFVPDDVFIDDKTVTFPVVAMLNELEAHPQEWTTGTIVQHEGEHALKRRRYIRGPR